MRFSFVLGGFDWLQLSTQSCAMLISHQALHSVGRFLDQRQALRATSNHVYPRAHIDQQASFLSCSVLSRGFFFSSPRSALDFWSTTNTWTMFFTRSDVKLSHSTASGIQNSALLAAGTLTSNSIRAVESVRLVILLLSTLTRHPTLPESPPCQLTAPCCTNIS